MNPDESRDFFILCLFKLVRDLLLEVLKRECTEKYEIGILFYKYVIPAQAGILIPVTCIRIPNQSDRYWVGNDELSKVTYYPLSK